MAEALEETQAEFGVEVMVIAGLVGAEVVDAEVSVCLEEETVGAEVVTVPDMDGLLRG